MADLVVEIRDNLRRTTNFYQVKTFPLKIGRGYSNDIILTDPHVCSEHLVINETENGWSAEDLDTKNGVHVIDKTGHQKSLELRSGDEIVIGKTHLKFVEPDHPVAPTRVLKDRNSLIEITRSVALVWALLCVLVVGVSFENYLDSTKIIHIEKLIVNSLPVVGGVMAWSALWALLAYIVRRRLFFNFLLGVSIAYYLLDTLLASVLDYVAFNINNILFIEAVSYFTSGLLLVVLFYVSMSRALIMTGRRRLFLANIFSWTIVAVIGFIVFANKPEFSRNPAYSAELKPPFARMVPVTNLNDFVAKSDSLVVKLEH